MTNAEIGNRIKYARGLRDVTLDDIAKKVGIAKSTIQRYETGKITTIKIPVVESIAIALNVNPAWIVGKSEEMELPSQKVPKIIQYYERLNDIGKHEAEKRVEELTYLQKYTKEGENKNNTVEFSEELTSDKDYLLPNAAHADESLTKITEEMIQAEEDIMDDENFHNCRKNKAADAYKKYGHYPEHAEQNAAYYRSQQARKGAYHIYHCVALHKKLFFRNKRYACLNGGLIDSRNAA